MVSYGIHLSLAFLFCFVLLVDNVLIPAFRSGHKSCSVTSWLLKHHSACLWSSLIFALTLSVASLLQWIDHESNGVYENFAIVQALLMTYFSLVLITVAHYCPINRPRLFGLIFIATTVFSSYPVFRPAVSGRGSSLLAACIAYAWENDKVWKYATIEPFSSEGRLFLGLTTVVAALLICAWLVLRRHKLSYTCADESVSIASILIYGIV